MLKRTRSKAQVDGPTLRQRGENLWEVSGKLDMDSVPLLLDQASDLLQNGTEIVVDLSGVKRIDSAGLALLVEWLREARHRDISICFKHIPARMWPIAKICGLEQILPAEAFKDKD